MAAHSVLENVNLAAWIRWHEDEGILIPNVPEFVERVLRIYFPDMRKVCLHSSSPN